MKKGTLTKDKKEVAMPDVVLPPKVASHANEVLKNVRSVVIVGANGTGKSRLGAWMETSHASPAKVHRVSAQRAIAIPDLINPTPYEKAESLFRFGVEMKHASMETEQQQANTRWIGRWGRDPVGRTLNDFNHLLELLFADERMRDRAYSRPAISKLPTVLAPSSKLDRLAKVWASVLPQRALVIGDDKVEAQLGINPPYHGREMSDGERVAFYLIGEALCAPENGVIVIDEPEIHLHRAIQAPLWDEVERARPDCAFVYITHDLDFAATRVDARKIWLQSFDGNGAWEWEEVCPNPFLPEPLLLEILGNRRPVLFVEGDESSYDTAVYRLLFPNELVIPRGSGQKVIEATKAMANVTKLHTFNVRGLIDRDCRSDAEIGVLQGAGLAVADVAEVENLLCLPEALEAVAVQLRCDDVAGIVASAQKAVLQELEKLIEEQAVRRAIAELQFRLGGFGPKAGKTDTAKLEGEMQTFLKGINVSAVVAQCRELFAGIVKCEDYRGALRFFNCKGIPAFVAKAFGVTSDRYCEMVLGLLKAVPDGAFGKGMREATNMPEVLQRREVCGFD